LRHGRFFLILSQENLAARPRLSNFISWWIC